MSREVTSQADEPVVHISQPLPPGYTFVRKGNVYLTKNCRRLAREAQRTVYIVQDASRTLQGIRVPTHIWHTVRSMNIETSSTRAEALQKRDKTLEEKVQSELIKLFPRIPDDNIKPILIHTLKKRSGRVGRSTTLPLTQMVTLAVRAHIRHVHSNYDKLLKAGVDRHEARRRVDKTINSKATTWGFRSRGKSSKSKPQPLSARLAAKITPFSRPMVIRNTVPKGFISGQSSGRAKKSSITLVSTNKNKTCGTHVSPIRQGDTVSQAIIVDDSDSDSDYVLSD